MFYNDSVETLTKEKAVTDYFFSSAHKSNFNLFLQHFVL